METHELINSIINSKSEGSTKGSGYAERLIESELDKTRKKAFKEGQKKALTFMWARFRYRTNHLTQTLDGKKSDYYMKLKTLNKLESILKDVERELLKNAGSLEIALREYRKLENGGS